MLRTSKPFWIARMALALLVPPLLVELLLQLGTATVVLFAGAAGADRRDAEADHGSAAGKTACAALCVGDSFTYGLGSSDPANAYPMQLEKALRERPFRERSHVINAGWPGNTSRDALLSVKERLETVDPACVIVLVGVNDMWRAPELLREADLDRAAEAATASESTGGFRLEWRTRRLVQLLLQPRGEPAPVPTAAESGLTEPVEAAIETAAEAAPSAGTRPAAAQDPLIGRWRSSEGELTVHLDGTAEFAGVAYRWTHRGQSVDFVEAIRGGKTTRTQVMINERGAVFRPFPGTPAARRFARVEDDDRGRGETSAAGDGDGAGSSDAILERLTAEVAKHPADERARLKRLRGAQRAGAKDVVDEDVAFFEKRAAMTPAADAQRDLATALGLAGLVEEAGRVADELLAKDDGDGSLWFLVARAAQARGDIDGAVAAVDRSLASGSDVSNRPELLRFRSKLQGKLGDAPQAMHDTVAAWSIDQKDESLSREVMLAPNRYGEEQLAGVVETLRLDPKQRERLFAVVAKSIEGPDRAPLTVLVEHLTRLVDLCRERNITVFLLNYPTTRTKAATREEVDESQRLVAEETGTRLINLRAHFRRLMQSHEREEYFVADGHCNDAGYAEIARVVAAALTDSDATAGK